MKFSEYTTHGFFDEMFDDYGQPRAAARALGQFFDKKVISATGRKTSGGHESLLFFREPSRRTRGFTWTLRRATTRPSR